MSSIEVQVIRIPTAFATRGDFVNTFRRYITEDSCFIPSTQSRTPGIETGFSIRLADGTPMLRGLAVVLDSWETDENPWHTPGIRLGLRKLTKETRDVFDELQHARLARGSQEIIADDTAPVPMQDGVPDAVTDESDLTERCEMEAVPTRDEISTMLGFAPLPRPHVLPYVIDTRPKATMLGFVPLMKAVSIVELPELAALAAIEVTAIIPRPRRLNWVQRTLARLRAWYRTRSMR